MPWSCTFAEASALEGLTAVFGRGTGVVVGRSCSMFPALRSTDAGECRAHFLEVVNTPTVAFWTSDRLPDRAVSAVLSLYPIRRVINVLRFFFVSGTAVGVEVKLENELVALVSASFAPVFAHVILPRAVRRD